MNNGIQVRVIGPGGDHTDPLSQVYSLYIFERGLGGVYGLLQTNGTWTPVPEGSMPSGPTLCFPPEAAEPMFETLRVALGKDKPVESVVLREALAGERGRVDNVLQRLLKLDWGPDGTGRDPQP